MTNSLCYSPSDCSFPKVFIKFLNFILCFNLNKNKTSPFRLWQSNCNNHFQEASRYSPLSFYLFKMYCVMFDVSRKFRGWLICFSWKFFCIIILQKQSPFDNQISTINSTICFDFSTNYKVYKRGSWLNCWLNSSTFLYMAHVWWSKLGVQDFYGWLSQHII